VRASSTQTRIATHHVPGLVCCQEPNRNSSQAIHYAGALLYCGSRYEGYREQWTFGGYTARHVVTTRSYLVSQGTHRVDEVSDGWYIDLPAKPECKVVRFTPTSVQQVLELRKRGITKYKIIGKPETGYSVKLKNTEHIYLSRPDGSNLVSTVTKRELEVVEMLDHPLARSLFDVPAGFKRRTTRNPAIPPEMLSIEERG
jgi:hypothetical protein